MNVDVSVKLDPSLQENMTQREDRIIFQIASETLRESETTIPKDTGKMRKSSITAGVKGSNKDYYIGSYTSYATYVWNFPDDTHWTTQGTNNRWFERVWKEHGTKIKNNVIERNKL